MEAYESAISFFGDNNMIDHTFYSEIPENCTKKPCYVGIDEAGRGPVLGPMVYGIFVCIADEDAIQAKLDKGTTRANIEDGDPPVLLNVPKLNDSKQITDKVREEIVKQVAGMDIVAYGLKFIAPRQISVKSFKRQKIGLNTVSHDAAIELIQGLLDRKVNIKKVYVDTVGPMVKYQEKLEGLFPELKFKVDKKADAKYKAVSAASVFAKVARDRALKDWKFPDGMKIDVGPKGWGSGYPGDEVTKTFLKKNMDPVFGFPPIVRDSWQTSKTLLDKRGVKVAWESDDEDEAPVPKISKFFSKASKDDEQPVVIKTKCQFFSYRSLVQTVNF